MSTSFEDDQVVFVSLFSLLLFSHFVRFPIQGSKVRALESWPFVICHTIVIDAFCDEIFLAQMMDQTKVRSAILNRAAMLKVFCNMLHAFRPSLIWVDMLEHFFAENAHGLIGQLTFSEMVKIMLPPIIDVVEMEFTGAARQ